MVDDGNRVGPVGVPVVIKAGTDLRQHLAGCQYIKITEILFLVKIKILACNITTASDSNLAICDQQFVVHAMIGARIVIQVLEISERHAR